MGGRYLQSNERGLLTLSMESKFNMHEPKIQPHAQVRIKIYGINIEYWHLRILMMVARGAGILLQIDQATKDKK